MLTQINEVKGSVGREGTEVDSVFGPGQLPTFFNICHLQAALMNQSFNAWMLLIPVLGMLSACGTLTTWNGSHGGVKYTIHKDLRDNRIERNQAGRVMYDSPELTVISDAGVLEINGQQSGQVNKGDHVEITDMGTVLVNGQRRGDKTTGQAVNQHRLKERLAQSGATDQQIQQAGYTTE